MDIDKETAAMQVQKAVNRGVIPISSLSNQKHVKPSSSYRCKEPRQVRQPTGQNELNYDISTDMSFNIYSRDYVYTHAI